MRPVFRNLALFGATFSAPLFAQTSIQEVQGNLRQIAAIDKQPTIKLKAAFGEFCDNGLSDVYGNGEDASLRNNNYYCVHRDFVDVLGMVDTVGHYASPTNYNFGNPLNNFEFVVKDELVTAKERVQDANRVALENRLKEIDARQKKSVSTPPAQPPQTQAGKPAVSDAELVKELTAANLQLQQKVAALENNGCSTQPEKAKATAAHVARATGARRTQAPMASNSAVQ